MTWNLTELQIKMSLTPLAYWVEADIKSYPSQTHGMTKRIHPDAGVTRYTYDNAGNLQTEDNPLGQIYYDYTYCRPKHKRYSYMTGNDVTYTYGTSGTETGRPVRSVAMISSLMILVITIICTFIKKIGLPKSMLFHVFIVFSMWFFYFTFDPAVGWFAD